VDELIGDTTVTGLSTQWQSNYGAVVIAVLEQRHIKYFLEGLELVLELLDVLCVIFQVENGHIAALVVIEALVRIDEGHLVAAQNRDEVGNVKEGHEFGGVRVR